MNEVENDKFELSSQRGHCCWTLDSVANTSRFLATRLKGAFTHTKMSIHNITHHIHILSLCQLQAVYQWRFNFQGQQLATCVENMFLTLCWPGTNLRPRLYIDKVEIKLTAGIYYNIYT